jgi:hypothetical protein
MPKEPDNIVLRHLPEIRTTPDTHSKQLEALPRMEKQLADLSKVLRYSMGVNAETEFRQSEQQTRIDELFRQLEKLLSDK